MAAPYRAPLSSAMAPRRCASSSWIAPVPPAFAFAADYLRSARRRKSGRAAITAKPIYRAVAEAFIAEGVETLFVLTGDGNMHWEVAMAETPGFRSFHVRHEHCACAMASAYAR